MSMATRYLTVSDLPDILPVFPLTGVLLLPGADLPLTIFEDRYLAMVTDALQTRHRLIGIVQHKLPEATSAHDLCAIGCAGRITHFTETPDGRYQVALTGICRFRIAEELPQIEGYRRIKPDYVPFLSDIAAAADEMGAARGPLFDRVRFMRLLKSYFDAQGLSCNWDDIGKARDDHLMTALSMICPFSGGEKQALLEAVTLQARADVFFHVLERAMLEGTAKEDGHDKPTCH